MTEKERSAGIEYPVAPEIAGRKSIRAYSNQPVDEAHIRSLFEAVRWAPSSTNEQPWMYIYATADQSPLFEKMRSALSEFNRAWADSAPLLVLAMTRKTFTKNGQPNAHAEYDLGGANAFLSLQAVHLGMQVRQMAGFNKETAIRELNIPEGYEPVVFIAIGYPGDPDTLPEKLRTRELAPRERYKQQSFVMNGPF